MWFSVTLPHADAFDCSVPLLPGAVLYRRQEERAAGKPPLVAADASQPPVGLPDIMVQRSDVAVAAALQRLRAPPGKSMDAQKMRSPGHCGYFLKVSGTGIITAAALNLKP